MLGLFLASLALSSSLVCVAWAQGDADLDARGPLGSLRFWILALIGFGLAGAPLSMLGLMPALVIPVAVGTGWALGRLLWPLFEETSGEVTLSGLVGVEGRAVLAIGPGIGKVVVQTLASRLELPARSGDGTAIAPGQRVVVACIEQGVARVVSL